MCYSSPLQEQHYIQPRFPIRELNQCLHGNTKEKDRTMPLTTLELELHQARVQRNRHQKV